MSRKWYFDPLKPGSYNVVLADPATRFQNFSAFESDKGPQYRTMSDNQIRNLPMRHLAAADCLFVIWSTFPKLEITFSYIKSWGLRYVTGGSWHKTTINGKTARGLGKVVATCAEPWLLCAIGKPLYVKKPIKGVMLTEEEHDLRLIKEWTAHEGFDGLRRENSRKPDEQYALIDQLMGDVPRCELFARTRWPGYDSWGDQADHFKPMGDDQ